MTGLLRAAARLTVDERRRLVVLATAVTVPIAAIVLVLDLIAWRQVPPRAGVERELGDSVRTVDEGRFTILAIGRYLIGAAVYVLVAAIALRPLQRSLSAQGSFPAAASREIAAALAIGALAIAAVRVAASLTGAAAFAATAGSGALVYLALMNAVHAVAKIATAPFAAALIAVAALARRRELRDGRDA